MGRPIHFAPAPRLLELRRRAHPARAVILLAVVVLLSACSGGGGGSGADELPPAFTVAPTLTPGPAPETPLVATITCQTDEPTRLTLHLDDGFRQWSVPPRGGYVANHDVLVLGVEPDRMHAIQVEAEDAAGNATLHPSILGFTTPPLPAGFPGMATTVSQPALMEPGFRLVAPFCFGSCDESYILIVNAAGAVVWWHHVPDNVADVRRLTNGNILYQHGDFGLREIDMLGTVVQEWWAANLEPQSAPPGAVLVAADTFHHETYELPPGHAADFVTLATELRFLANYPANIMNPTVTFPSAPVVGDVIIEFRRDGTILREWKLLDILDPYRICYGAFGALYNDLYGITTVDWSHGNAVIPVPGEDAYIISLRHQDALIKLDAATGQVLWILGDPGRWTPPWSNQLLQPANPGMPWSYHHHAPVFTSSGTLLLFDNGNERAIPPAPELPAPQRYCRVVEYAIDELSGTVSEVWSYGGPNAPWYSPALGDADPLPLTGNVLVCDGFKIDALSGYARVFELAPGLGDAIVFELFIGDPTAQSWWFVYRAEHLDDVYP